MLAPGFADPVGSAQATFRAVLTVLSEPGRILTLEAAVTPPPGMGLAMTAVGLSLLDCDTPLWCDRESAATADYFRFHAGVPVTAMPDKAAFALIRAVADMPRLDCFPWGSDAYPDRSATLVVEVEALGDGPGLMLEGPGIAGRRLLRLAGLPERFAAEWRAASQHFPRGLDILFTCGDRLAGMPRSSRIVE